MKPKQPSAKKLRLIFHIGAGKTGTSSIQRALQKSDAELKKNGIAYLGLVLENTPNPVFDWQQPTASKELLSLDDKVIQSQMVTAFKGVIEWAEKENMHTLIWSNEWFFRRHELLIPVIQRIEQLDVDVDIIAYVRRHDAWAKSSYTQWGLKSKTYVGKLQKFKRFIKRRPLHYFDFLSPWINRFDDKVIVRNFDANKDVVTDFFNICGLDVAVENVRVNETPTAEELLLRVLFNSEHKERVPINVFQRVFKAKDLDFNLNLNEWVNSFLPTQKDLHNIQNEYQQDRKKINQILTQTQQAELATDEIELKPLTIDSEKLSFALAQIVVKQAIKLEEVETQLKKLNQQNTKKS